MNIVSEIQEDLTSDLTLPPAPVSNKDGNGSTASNITSIAFTTISGSAQAIIDNKAVANLATTITVTGDATLAQAATLRANEHASSKAYTYNISASYADLIGAFGTNTDAGQNHWKNNGRSEGRRFDIFDATQYLANYFDLSSAFGSDTEAATSH